MAGQFCISIDLELAWGIWDKLSDEYVALCSKLERQIVERLLGSFNKYEISATWAIVGSLLADPQPRSGGADDVWYAPDLIEAIRSSRTPQEIGSHSFAHIYFPQSSAEEVRRDLEAAQSIHTENDLAFASFVFPRNMVAHEAALAGSGIKVFRSVDRGWYISVARANRYAGRVANLLDKVLPIAPATVRPIRHANGLVELPSSMLLMGRNGARRLISSRVTTRKARLGLEAASRKGEVFHLWFHPSNFYHSTEVQLNTLDRILQVAAEMRERGDLEIVPMGAFAA